MIVKAKKMNGVNVFEIPDNVKATDGEYYVTQSRNGSIIYSPKRKNIFKDEKFIATHDWKQKEISIGPLVGKEKFD